MASLISRYTKTAKQPTSDRQAKPQRSPRRHGRGVPQPPGPKEKGSGRFLSWGDGR